MAEPAEPSSTSPASAARRATPKQLAALFLRLGVTAFGGPAAHIAMMEDEVVVRRKWLSRQQFLDLLGAANLIPGPTSSEMAIYIGQNQAGWMGLLLGGGCFILPAALIVALASCAVPAPPSSNSTTCWNLRVRARLPNLMCPMARSLQFTPNG
jgi:chromate transporter